MTNDQEVELISRYSKYVATLEQDLNSTLFGRTAHRVPRSLPTRAGARG